MLTRKQLVYKAADKIEIDYNYNYEVMQNIYKFISEVDSDLEKRLHDNGFRVEEGHSYKLFNFSLLFSNAKFLKNNIELDKNSIAKLVVSGKGDIIEKILEGARLKGELILASHKLTLDRVANDKFRSRFAKVMKYSTLSPVIVSTKDDFGNKKYLHPYDMKFYRNLVNNAKKKYRLIYGKPFKGNIYFDVDDNVKSKSMKIKNGFLIGYNMDMWIEAPIDMQKIIYYLGLGQNSSTGMGCLSIQERIE